MIGDIKNLTRTDSQYFFIKESCLFCENSFSGFVCYKCSTSGKSYLIKCPVCLGKLIAFRDSPKNINPDFKVDISFNREILCESCKLLAVF